jgi:hypothetical protein
MSCGWGVEFCTQSQANSSGRSEAFQPFLDYYFVCGGIVWSWQQIEKVRGERRRREERGLWGKSMSVVAYCATKMVRYTACGGTRVGYMANMF